MRYAGRLVQTVLGVLLMCSTQVRAEDTAETLKGSFSLNFSYEQSDYVSRQLALSGDLGYDLPGHEVGTEFAYSKKYIELPNVGTTILSEKYDANVKWKNYLGDTLYYTYLSPRIRHNLNGYYTYAQALRVGLGKKIMLYDDTAKLLLEAGTGYRTARLYTDEQVQEVLYTLSSKLDWKLSETLILVFNFQHEQSSQESYRTAKLSMKNKLSTHFGIVYEYTHTRAYPFDAQDKTTEQSSTIGLAYEI